MAEKRILDEETRKQLLGYTPFSSSCTLLFTPEEFKNLKEDLRPIFTIRAFNQDEVNQLRKNSSGYIKATNEEIMAIAEANKKLVSFCISNWSNLYDSGTGEEIEFNIEKFFKFPGWLINTIIENVRKISGLSAAEDLGLK